MAVVANGEANVQEQLIEWKDIFSRLGLSVSLEKTEVMWVGHRRKELKIHLDGKKLKQRDILSTWTERYVEMAIRQCQQGKNLWDVVGRWRSCSDELGGIKWISDF